MTKDLSLGVGYRYVSFDKEYDAPALLYLSFRQALIDHYAQSIVGLVFFPTYVLFQPPSTVLTRKLGPRTFLATICMLWGAVEIVGILCSSVIACCSLNFSRGLALSGHGQTCSGFGSYLGYSNQVCIQVLSTFWLHGTLGVSDTVRAARFSLQQANMHFR